MRIRNWLIAGGTIALLGACNSNDSQRAPRPANASPSTTPEGRAGPTMSRTPTSRDGGVGPGAGISSGLNDSSQTTSGTSTGLNAGTNAPATGTTSPNTTPTNGSGTDNSSGSSNPTQH